MDGAALQTDPLDEDLAGNLTRVSELARRYCNGCADYHVTFVGRRLVRVRHGEARSRDALLVVTSARLASFADSSGAIDVLIAGTGDTGLPAVAAKAARAAGPGIFARLQLTVIDRCSTPLELTREYAEKAGIPVRVERCDLLQASHTFEANVIIVDSLFRQVPRGYHVIVLQRLARWLKPRGSIVFSSSIGPKRDADRRQQRRADQGGALQQLIRKENHSLSEPLGDFVARAKREEVSDHHVHEYDSLEAANEVFKAAGLTTVDQRRESSAHHERIKSVFALETDARQNSEKPR